MGDMTHLNFHLTRSMLIHRKITGGRRTTKSLKVVDSWNRRISTRQKRIVRCIVSPDDFVDHM